MLCELCGVALKLKKDIKGNGTLKWTQKKLKKGKNYKYMVVAYKNVGDKKMTLAASVLIHSTAKGGKLTVAKSVKASPASVILEIGQTVKLKASEVKAEKGKMIKRHRDVQFESDNPTVATVVDDGTITAVGEGSTIIYAYAQNGLYKTVTVTVTPGQIVPNTVEDPETEEDALSVEIVEPTDEERTDIELDDTTVEDEIIDAGETQCLPGMFSIECFLPGDIALHRIADNKECVSKMRIKHFETHSNYGRSSAYPHPLLSGPIVPEV